MTAQQGGSPASSDTLEAILRHLVALRSSTAIDEELVQLLRMVDSATWSAPVPITILVDGTLVHGVLVPGEVSSAYLDNELGQFATDALSQLEPDASAASSEEDPQRSTRSEQVVRQARGFARRIGRQPFATSQAQRRQRNANALVALNSWHRPPAHDNRLTPLDIPGNFTDPESPARDVIPYMTGQRALTLTDAEILVDGKWLPVRTPVRVSVARIGVWTIGQ